MNRCGPDSMSPSGFRCTQSVGVDWGPSREFCLPSSPVGSVAGLLWQTPVAFMNPAWAERHVPQRLQVHPERGCRLGSVAGGLSALVAGGVRRGLADASSSGLLWVVIIGVRRGLWQAPVASRCYSVVGLPCWAVGSVSLSQGERSDVGNDICNYTC